MDIGRAFSYVFEDNDWVKKVLIGGVINLIPIVSFAAMGYGIDQTRRVYEGRELPLPEWDNFGSYFMKGLMSFVAIIIYALPAVAIYCCAFVLPTMIISSSTSGSGQTTDGPLATLAAPLAICAICLVSLYIVALVFFVPALMVRYALTDQFNAYFQFGPAWQLINTNISSYIIGVVGLVLAGIIGSLVASITCGVGAPWTGFWTNLAGAHLFGTFARDSIVPIAPLGTGA